MEIPFPPSVPPSLRPSLPPSLRPSVPPSLLPVCVSVQSHFFWPFPHVTCMNMRGAIAFTMASPSFLNLSSSTIPICP
eukprot:762472-Hanusia_phi.AAC.2